MSGNLRVGGGIASLAMVAALVAGTGPGAGAQGAQPVIRHDGRVRARPAHRGATRASVASDGSHVTATFLSRAGFAGPPGRVRARPAALRSAGRDGRRGG